MTTDKVLPSADDACCDAGSENLTQIQTQSAGDQPVVGTVLGDDLAQACGNSGVSGKCSYVFAPKLVK